MFKISALSTTDKLGAVHHYVPQSYLKRFAIDGKPDQVVAYEVGKEPYAVNVHNVAGQRDFYTYTITETGAQNSAIEDVLAEVDEQGVDAIKELDGLPDGFVDLPKKQKEHLLTYVAFQHTRNLQERKAWATMYEQSARVLMQAVASNRESYHGTSRKVLGDKYNGDTVEKTRQIFLKGEAGITYNPMQPYFMGNALDMSKEVYMVLFARKRMVLVSKADDAGVFVTSDNPVTHYLTEEQRASRPAMFQGVGYIDAVFQLPISPDRCLLFINHNMTMNTFRYNQSAVDYINYHTYHFADRWVFSNLKDEATKEHLEQFKRKVPVMSIRSPFDRANNERGL